MEYFLMGFGLYVGYRVGKATVSWFTDKIRDYNWEERKWFNRK
jgi:hypothetical protein